MGVDPRTAPRPPSPMQKSSVTTAAEPTQAAATAVAALVASARVLVPPLSLDVARTKVSPATIDAVLKTTASQAHLKAIADKADAASQHRLAAGDLTLGAFFQLVARCHFGARANQKTTYASCKASLEARGLAAEWRAMLDVIPADLRARHLNGAATPLELYAA